MDYDNTKSSLLLGLLPFGGAFLISYCIACYWGEYVLFPDVTELNWTTAMDFAVFTYVNANWAWLCWLIAFVFYGGAVGIGLLVDKCE
jgi:hypothetical protein